MAEPNTDAEKVLYYDLKHFIDLGTEIITVPEDTIMNEVVEYSYNYLNVIVERSNTIYKILIDANNIDIFSAEILLRSLMEAYVNFFDIIFNSEKDEIRKLKVLRSKAISDWESLNMFDMVGNDNPEGRKLLQDIFKTSIEAIIKSEAFASLTNKKEKKLYSDIKGWYKKVYKTDIILLAKNAGISENNARLFYQYSSNYAHCDPFAVDHAGIFIKHGKPEFFKTTILIQTTAILTKSIEMYSKINTDLCINDEDVSLRNSYWKKMNIDIKEQ